MNLNKNISFNKDHEFPFELFGKTWLCYLPGWEGLYCISDDLNILRLERTIVTAANKKCTYKNKLLKENNTTKSSDLNHKPYIGTFIFHLNVNGVITVINKVTLLNTLMDKGLISNKIKLPINLYNKDWVCWIPGYENRYALSLERDILSIGYGYIDKRDFERYCKIKKWSLVDNYKRVSLTMDNVKTTYDYSKAVKQIEQHNKLS